MHMGTRLLQLGSPHGLAIFNGLSQWPVSDGFTHWNHKFTHGNHKKGESTLDYLIGSLADLRSFTVSDRLIALCSSS